MIEKMVDINEAKLFVREIGENKPTVIFESAMGMPLKCWLTIQQEISKVAHTVSYDRACNGKSQDSLYERNCKIIAQDLHELLYTLKFVPPFLFVGASYGCYIIRTYASLYGNEVAGVVFAEPSHEDFLEEMKKERTASEWQELTELSDRMAKMTPGGYKKEWKSYFDDSNYVRNLVFPVHIPTVIISSIRYGSVEQVIMKYRKKDIEMRKDLHRRLLTEHRDSKQIITTKSGHDVIAEEPELVIKAIKDLINSLYKMSEVII